MAENYVLSCCSTADLTDEQFEARSIHYICFHFELGGKSYMDDLGKSIPFDEFYKRMEQGEDTKTSQINAEEFEQYFEPFLQEGKDILHVCLSSGISGVMNSACIARDILAEKYPDRKIYIVDSLAASAGYGLTIDELRDWAEANKLHLRHWFFSSDLTFFIKGGRVSKSAGTIGNLLNICPLLDVNSEGKLIPRFKIRGKRKVIREIVAKMEEDAEKARFPNLNGKVVINNIGTTIGSHTGPGTVALFFWGSERTL